jgi:hypothetical protein
MTPCPYGFRIVGATSEARRLVDAAAALRGYAACDERAEVHRQAYLSSFAFGDAFRRQLEESGSTRGFSGICWSPWLWWDIDRENDLDRALSDTRRLALALDERFGAGEDLLVFYSGSKGFHVGLPTRLWQPAPSAVFNRVARRFAETIAGRIGVAVDGGVYDQVRPFRAPNSRHQKTGRHKRRLSLDELLGLSTDGILRLAEKPEPFEVPSANGRCERACSDWLDAVNLVQREAAAKAQRPAVRNGAARLNRGTLDFIRDGASTGDRHRLLFSAAANLAEFGCPPALAHALLSEAALDSGLPPKEVRRQIECGLVAGKGGADA